MQQGLSVETRHEAGAGTVVRLSGRFDHLTASHFGKAMRECLQKGVGEVLVDCAGLTYIDSMAMGTLLVYREKLANAGGKLVLANCHGPVRAAMDLANFQRIFEIR